MRTRTSKEPGEEWLLVGSIDLSGRGVKNDEPDEDEEEEEKKEERATKESVVELDLLKKDRTIIISEVITPKLTQRVMSQLLWLDSQGAAPIKLYINTPGGSADDGFAVFDLIRFVRAPVFTICVGLNASAGTLVLLGAPKERRLALPNARIMIHQPSGGSRGRASDIEITAEEILKLRQRANELIAAETGKPISQVEKDTDRDCWLSADEAKSYGLVSRVIKSLRDIQ
jgi:ATP-dependent Clp protease protease subunit